jgi:hypothetical protein
MRNIEPGSREALLFDISFALKHRVPPGILQAIGTRRELRPGQPLNPINRRKPAHAPAQAGLLPREAFTAPAAVSITPVLRNCQTGAAAQPCRK